MFAHEVFPLLVATSLPCCAIRQTVLRSKLVQTGDKLPFKVAVEHTPAVLSNRFDSDAFDPDSGAKGGGPTGAGTSQ
jgi:hypothetical protein